MSFWLSAIPVQNCSLNLNVDSQKTRETKAPPTVQINAGSYDTHASHRTHASLPVRDCGDRAGGCSRRISHL